MIIASEISNQFRYKSSNFSFLLHENIFSLSRAHFVGGWKNSTGRTKRQPFISQTSSVTEAPSDDVEAEQEGDEDVEPARVTQ